MIGREARGDSTIEMLTTSQEFQRDLVDLMPWLLSYARKLCGNSGGMEDIAQDTLMKAWRSRHRFQSGTNLKAWLFTILRNEFYSRGRRSGREWTWDESLCERVSAPTRQQEWAADLRDVTRALEEIPEGQRNALLLVTVGGYSYDETARICGTPSGTVKSRVARGRIALTSILDGDRQLPSRQSAKPETGALTCILAQLDVLKPLQTSPTCIAKMHR